MSRLIAVPSRCHRRHSSIFITNCTICNGVLTEEWAMYNCECGAFNSFCFFFAFIRFLFIGKEIAFAELRALLIEISKFCIVGKWEIALSTPSNAKCFVLCVAYILMLATEWSSHTAVNSEFLPSNWFEYYKIIRAKQILYFNLCRNLPRNEQNLLIGLPKIQILCFDFDTIRNLEAWRRLFFPNILFEYGNLMVRCSCVSYTHHHMVFTNDVRMI